MDDERKTLQKAHILTHVPFEGPGMIKPYLEYQGIDCITVPLYKNPSVPSESETECLIVMGGPMGPEDSKTCPWLTEELNLIQDMIEAGKPVLGICLGAQLIAHVLGYSVYPAEDHEIGWYPVSLTDAGKQHPATKHWHEQPTVFHWHSNTFDLPEEAVHLASTQLCSNQAFVLNETVIGLQFHLEMGRSQIQEMIDNWGRYRESGTYVQSPEEMLRQSEYAAETRVMLHHLLDYWLLNRQTNLTR